jgi:hypothetical protein
MDFRRVAVAGIILFPRPKRANETLGCGAIALFYIRLRDGPKPAIVDARDQAVG